MTTAVHPTAWHGEQAKRSREVVTPEGVPLRFTLAARSARVGALIIDYIVINVVFFVVTGLLIWLGLGVLGLGEQSLEEMGGALELLIVVWFVFYFVLWNGYFIWFEMGARGATPGKRAVGIRVAARDGGRLTPEAIVARNLLRQIELFLPLVLLQTAPSGEAGLAGIAATAWFLTFMLFPFVNRDVLRAGDVIAGTWVVEAPRSKLRQALSTEGAAKAPSTVTGTQYRFDEDDLSVYGEYELQTLERVLREDNEDSLVAVHDTICRKIGWEPGAGDERAFLEAFYAQLRARLEGDMRYGKRKADKHAA